jgi:hypothetical protein
MVVTPSCYPASAETYHRPQENTEWPMANRPLPWRGNAPCSYPTGRHDPANYRFPRGRPESSERRCPLGETPYQVSGTSDILPRSVCRLYRCHSSDSPPRHLETGSHDESRGALQLHVTAASLAAGTCNVVVLEEADQPYRSHQVFHLSL